MLSKVLSRASAGGIAAMVFPQVSRETGERRPGEAERPPAPRGQDREEIAGLREKLQQLETRAAVERREAFESGKQQGEQQARAEIQPVLERLKAATVDVLGMRPELRRRAERDTVQLALLIAKRILHRQLSVDEGALTAIARVAFERLTRSESYRVTVHPQFAAAVSSALPAGHLSRVQIQPDPDCAPGTLIIHSEEGTIDASLDTQLEEISRGLTDRLAV